MPPDAVRDERSYSYVGYGGMHSAGYFDSDRGVELLAGITMADCGNITVVPTDILDNFQKLTNVVEKIASHDSMPVIVGGCVFSICLCGLHHASLAPLKAASWTR